MEWAAGEPRKTPALGYHPSARNRYVDLLRVFSVFAVVAGHWLSIVAWNDAGRLRLDEGQALLYSLGQNHADDRARRHSDDGADGELVLWPPIRAVSREQGLLP